ncbi:hypothetical protein TNCV_1691201 [Trichonephila clavipes]|nr:hypothetical protein TNCV_1691201 [Trichonephila clavipes]
MDRCPDQVVNLKRDPQCLSPQASLVLIYRPTAVVDLAQLGNRARTRGVEARYSTTGLSQCIEICLHAVSGTSTRVDIHTGVTHSSDSAADDENDAFSLVFADEWMEKSRRKK